MGDAGNEVVYVWAEGEVRIEDAPWIQGCLSKGGVVKNDLWRRVGLWNLGPIERVRVPQLTVKLELLVSQLEFHNVAAV